jgi:hypothetical protein
LIRQAEFPSVAYAASKDSKVCTPYAARCEKSGTPSSDDHHARAGAHVRIVAELAQLRATFVTQPPDSLTWRSLRRNALLVAIRRVPWSVIGHAVFPLKHDPAIDAVFQTRPTHGI